MYGGEDDIQQQITEISSQFKLFECVQCVQAIQAFLISRGIPGKRIRLYTGSSKGKYGNIYHDRLKRNISTNGRHEGVAVEFDGKELVFDNIHPEGIVKDDWLKNFYCLALDLDGDFEIEEIQF